MMLLGKYLLDGSLACFTCTLIGHMVGHNFIGPNICLIRFQSTQACCMWDFYTRNRSCGFGVDVPYLGTWNPAVALGFGRTGFVG